MPAYCEVALPVPIDRTFTYAIREGQLPQRGTRVIVPFNNEKLIGVVTALSVTAPPEFNVRPLEAVLDAEPLLSEQLLSLAEWMAQYYLAPLGEVLRGMLPLMAEVRRTVYYRISDAGRDALAKSLDGEGSHPSRKVREKNGAPGLEEELADSEVSNARSSPHGRGPVRGDPEPRGTRSFWIEAARKRAQRAAQPSVARSARHGAAGARAAGQRRASEGFHAAHGDR